MQLGIYLHLWIWQMLYSEEIYCLYLYPLGIEPMIFALLFKMIQSVSDCIYIQYKITISKKDMQ